MESVVCTSFTSMTKYILMIKQIVEKRSNVEEEMYLAFLDLEKVINRLPRSQEKRVIQRQLGGHKVNKSDNEPV